MGPNFQMGMPSQGCRLGGAQERVSQKAELEHPGAPNLQPRPGPKEARREGGPGEELQEVVAAPTGRGLETTGGRRFRTGDFALTA